MGLINDLLLQFAEKKLGADFEQHLTDALDQIDSNDGLAEVIEHYEGILRTLVNDYCSVKLDPDDLLTITIDDKEYNLDGKSTVKERKLTEHRMAIEFFLADAEDAEDLIKRVEKYLNNK